MRRRPHGCRGALCLHVPPPDLPDSGLTPDAGPDAGSSPGPDAGPDAGAGPICSPSADLVAAGLACHADDDCPCGAHCTLGRCAADCQTALDCDAGYCDIFGRCRALDDTSIIPALEPQTQSTALLRSPALSLPGLLDAGAIGSFTLTSPARGMRLGADVGMGLSCPDADDAGPDADGGYDCWFGPRDAGTLESFAVHATTPFDGGETRTVMLYVDDQVRSFSVTSQNLAPTPPTPDAPPVGFYAGTIRLLDQGVSTDPAGVPSISADSDGGDPFTVPPSALVIPIQAQVDGPSGSLLLALSDQTQLFGPGGRWVGEISGGDAGLLAFPDYQLLSGTLIPSGDGGADVEVVMHAEPTAVSVGAGGVSFSFELDVSATGVLGTGGPASRFLVSLAAVDGGIGVDGGLVPQTPYLPALSPSRATTPSTWETVASADLAVPFSGGSEKAASIEGTLLDYWRIDGGGLVDGGVRLDACGRSDSDLNALQNIGFYAALSTPQLVAASDYSGDTDVVLVPAGTYQAQITGNGPLIPILDAALQNAVQTFGGAATSMSATALILYTANDGSHAASGLSPRAIPCHLAVSVQANITANISLGTESLIGASAGTVDTCDQLAATYGCAIEPDPVGSRTGGTAILAGTGYTIFGSGTFNGEAAFTATNTQVCVLPPNPPICPQAWDCAVPTADPNAGVDSSLLTSVAQANSGDLTCAAGPFSETIAFDENNEPSTSNPLDAAQLFTDCLSELGATSAPPPPGAPGTTSVKALLAQSPHCVDVQRLLLSLGSGYPQSGPAPLEVQALAARTFQRWIKLHTFLAQEAIEQEGVGQILRQSGAPTAPPTLDASLQAVLSGWALLLHPRFAAILEGIDSRVLVQSDYRAWLDPEVRYPAGTDQGGGLPAAILQNLDAAMHLAQIALQEAWSAGRTSDIPELTELLRETLVLRPLAYDLAARAQAAAAQTGANLAWATTYQALDASLSADLQAFQLQLAAFLAGRNPLGIEDSDLPLYFLGANLGAGGQFAAVSDYLLGSGPGSTAWAPALVAQASTDLTAAETAYQQQQDRMLAQQEAASDEANREEALETQYGSQILNLCGTFANLPADQILDQAGNLDGHSCYYSSDTDCHVSNQAFAQLVTPDDVKYQLCLIGALKASAGPNVMSTDPNLDQLAQTIQQQILKAEAQNLPSQEIAELVANLEKQLKMTAGDCNGGQNAAYCVSSTSSTSVPQTEILAESFATIQVPQVAGSSTLLSPSQESTTSTSTTALIQQLLEQQSSVLAPQTQSAQQLCQLAVPSASTNLPSIGELNPNLTNGTCYQGSLGQLALAVQTAGQTLDLAEAHFSDAQSAYAAASQTCLALQQQLMQSENVLEGQIDSSLQQVNQQMQTAQKVVGSLGGLLSRLIEGAQQDCVSAPGFPAGIEAAIHLVGFPLGGVGSIANCLAARAQQGSLQSQLSGAQQQQQQLMQQLQTTSATLMAQDATALQACANNVSQYFLAVQNASTEVQQAVNAEISAQYQLNNQAQQVGLLLAEGRQSLAVMRGHSVIPPDADFWLRSDIETYQRDFQLAQLATYLAERSVEYEYQISLADRAKTLAAQSPSDLSGVLEDLYLAAGSRQINGASPSDLEVVISLRDQLLQLADQTKLPVDRQRLTATQRFQMLLRSPKYASYDSQGNYLGQKIPFSLVPEGTLKIGNAQGITVLAGSDCAERLWNVNASVLGSEPLLYGNQNQVFTNIDLLKSNTFYSQWCGNPPTGGPPFQVASVDPGRNLFEIPSQGAAVGNNFGVSSTETQYTTARIQAFFNVDATTFEASSYDNGSTQELAARGLFGDYALFLPASTLSQQTPAGATNGLILNNVSDILLRLDYVSVANGP